MSGCHRCFARTRNNERCSRLASCRMNCVKVCWQHSATRRRHSCRDTLRNPRDKSYLPKTANWNHIPSPGNGIAIQPSTLPHAGQGLFATEIFLPNEIVAEYTGRIVDQQRAKVMMRNGQDTHLATLMSNFLYIDGRGAAGAIGGGAKANDAKGPGNNVFFYKRGGTNKLYLQVKPDRMIRAGDEIFVGYGKSYWSRH